MTDEEYVRILGKFMQMTFDMRDNKDYTVNPPQMDKFLDIIAFFQEIIDELGGEFEEITATPKEESGGLTASFVVLNVMFDKIERFCDVMRYSSGFCIDTTLDGKTRISLSVPHVFVRKQR